MKALMVGLSMPVKMKKGVHPMSINNGNDKKNNCTTRLPGESHLYTPKFPISLRRLINLLTSNLCFHMRTVLSSPLDARIVPVIFHSIRHT